jgi:hypothetical protein
MLRGETSECVHKEASERLLSLVRMAEHQVSVVEAARLRLNCLTRMQAEGSMS